MQEKSLEQIIRDRKISEIAFKIKHVSSIGFLVQVLGDGKEIHTMGIESYPTPIDLFKFRLKAKEDGLALEPSSFEINHGII